MIVDTLTAKMAFDGSDFFAGVTAVKGGLTSMGKAAHSASSLLDEAQDELKQFAEQTKKITATPLERYQDQVRKLNNALATGVMDHTTFSRGMQKANDDFFAAQKGASGFLSVFRGIGPAFVAGVAGAMAFSAATKVVNAGLNLLETGARAAFDQLAQGFQMAGEKEQATAAFKTMLGDLEKAKRLTADIETFALATPFGVRDLTETVKQLKGYGIATEDLLPLTRTFGDMSQGNIERLMGMGRAFAQAQSKGKLMAQELNQFSEQGLNLRPSIAKVLGIKETDVSKAIEEGKVGINQLRSAIIDLHKTNFATGMEDQANTGIGALNRLKESAALFSKDIAEAFGVKLNTTEWMNDLAGFLEYVRTEWGPGLKEGVNQFVDVMLEATDRVRHAASTMEVAFKGLASMMPGGSNVANDPMAALRGASAVYNQKLPLAFGLNASLRELNPFFGGIDTGLANIGQFVDKPDTKADLAKLQEELKKKSAPVTMPKALEEAKKSTYQAISDVFKGGVSGLASSILPDLASGTRSLALNARIAGNSALGRFDSFLGGIKTGTPTEFKPTGALQVGSSEAFSQIIRNMFGKDDKSIPKEHLKATRDAVNVLKELLRTTQSAVREGTTVIESFAG